MCVAVIMNPGTELSYTEVEKMYMANADGVGVAWAKDGVVRWYKTTKVSIKYIAGLVKHWEDYPRLVHFRFSTAGGTRPELCHPFEIGPLATCKPVHETHLAMIHNGHWGRWDEVRDLLKSEGLLPDNGPWSDTRLAALLAHSDVEWLNALGGKVATMDGNGCVKTLGTWEQLREGIWVSNKSWENVSYKRGGYSGFRSWRGWEWDDIDWEEVAKEEKAAAEKAEKAHESTSNPHRPTGPGSASKEAKGEVTGNSVGPGTKLGTYEQSSWHRKGASESEENGQETSLQSKIEAGWPIVDALPEGAKFIGKALRTAGGRIYQATTARVVVRFVTAGVGEENGYKGTRTTDTPSDVQGEYTGDTEASEAGTSGHTDKISPNGANGKARR